MRERIKKIFRWLTTPLFIMVFVASSGLAIWSLNLDDTAVFAIESGGTPVIIFESFEAVSLDLSNESQIAQSNITLNNADGDIEFLLSVNEIKTDNVSDDCDDYENDCDLSYAYKGSAVADGDILTITSGDTILSVDLDCKKLSCPGSIESEISLDSVDI